MGHKLGYRYHPSNAIPTHCQVKKPVWEVPWWSICFPLSVSYDGVKGHFTGVYLSFWNLLSVSGQLFCWVLKWTLVLLLVLRCIYMSTEAALAVSSHYMFCSTCCKLVLYWTINLFLCGKERFNKKWQKKMWYHYHSDLFPVQRADLLASRQQTAVSRLILIGFINVCLTLFTLCMLSKIKMCYCLYAVPWSPLPKQAKTAVMPAVLIFVKFQDKQSMLFLAQKMKGKNTEESERRAWILKGALTIVRSKWLQSDREHFCSFLRERI